MDQIDAFIDAARYDEIDTLREMVAQGFNVNSQDEFGTTALHNACANGYMDCVQFLVQEGAQLIGNDSGNTPLHRAVLLQQMDIVKYLLASIKNADVLQKNAFGHSAVDVAFQTGNEGMVDLLLSHDSAQILEESVGYHGEEV